MIYSRDEKVTVDGKEFSITRKMFTFRTFEKTVQGKKQIRINFMIELNHMNSSRRICSNGY